MYEIKEERKKSKHLSIDGGKGGGTGGNLIESEFLLDTSYEVDFED